MKATGSNVAMQVRSDEPNQPALWSLCLTAQAEPKWASLVAPGGDCMFVHSVPCPCRWHCDNGMK